MSTLMSLLGALFALWQSPAMKMDTFTDDLVMPLAAAIWVRPEPIDSPGSCRYNDLASMGVGL